MINAYSKFYESDAEDLLSVFFDYAINDCGFQSNQVAAMFVETGCAAQFENSNPAVLAGMSGVEMARAVVGKACGERDLPKPSYSIDRSAEYWAGWALAQYQRQTDHSFQEIFACVPLSEVVLFYGIFHEMDIRHFVDAMEARIKNRHRA